MSENYTFEAQAGLVYDTVTDFNQLASEAYETARESLDNLNNLREDLPLTIVDVDIGTTIDQNWTGTEIDVPSDPEEPNYAGFLPVTVTITDPTEPTDPSIDSPTKPSDPVIDSIVIPSNVAVRAKVDDDLDLTGQPDDIEDESFSEIPEIGTLPEISAVTPTLDTDLLSADFSFTEPTYTERVSAEVEAGIKQVLGGDMGLPQGYWDSVWNEATGDLSRLETGRLRKARNRGAATYWGLPTEAVLVASREISDETVRAQQKARMEQARAQLVYAREDFWKAVAQGIAYEDQWINAHQQMAQRALAAAEAAVNLSVAVHNANVQRYNFIIEAAKLSIAVDQAKLQRVLSQFEANLKARELELQQDVSKVQRFQARWNGYQISTNAKISHLSEQIKHWSSTAEAHSGYTNLGLQAETELAKLLLNNDQANEQLQLQRDSDYSKVLLQKQLAFEGLKFQKTGLDLQQYSSLLQRITAVSQATAAVLAARTGVKQINLTGQQSILERASLINNLKVETAKITQAAQESKANIDISQAQWLEGQGNQLASSIADLAYGYAQAAVAAARVNLSSDVSNSFSETWSKDIT